MLKSRSRRPTTGRIGGRRVAAVIAPLVVGLSLSFAPAATTSATPGIQINVDPEVEYDAAGQTVTLTAEVRDQDGNPVGFGLARPLVLRYRRPQQPRQSRQQPGHDVHD